LIISDHACTVDLLLTNLAKWYAVFFVLHWLQAPISYSHDSAEKHSMAEHQRSSHGEGGMEEPELEAQTMDLQSTECESSEHRFELPLEARPATQFNADSTSPTIEHATRATEERSSAFVVGVRKLALANSENNGISFCPLH
jgi:hypothetical protein